MNDKQREFVIAILKVMFTVVFGGMAAGKLFALELESTRYLFASVSLLIILSVGIVIQKGAK